jgi:cation diffusion facilitator family transporter
MTSRATAQAGQIALASIAVAIAVTGIKAWAYFVTGSVALFSDAAEGLVNILTATVAFLAVRMAARPADRHHQFGHHKIEYVSAVLEGVLIVLAALLILREALAALYQPRTLQQPALGIAITVVATLLNGAWSAFLLRRGKALRSPALVADGWHLAADVVTSLGVLVGLLLALATGWTLLDPLLAMGVAINVLWAGWILIRASVSGLLDEAASAEIAGLIRKAIEEGSTGAGAIEVHDLRTRVAGSAVFIEMHLVVPGAMTVSRAHDICDGIEVALRASIPGCRVLIHVEPESRAHGSGNAIVLS